MPSPAGRKSKLKRSHYTDAKKIEVVTTHLQLGSGKLTAAACNVNYALLRQWKMTEWWKELEDEIKADDNGVLDASLKKIVDKTLVAIHDRIENGDWLLNSKTGKVERVPVKLKDISHVTKDLLSERRKIGEAKQAPANAEAEADRLVKLASQFVEIAKLAKEQGKREQASEEPRLINAEQV